MSEQYFFVRKLGLGKEVVSLRRVVTEASRQFRAFIEPHRRLWSRRRERRKRRYSCWTDVGQMEQRRHAGVAPTSGTADFCLQFRPDARWRPGFPHAWSSNLRRTLRGQPPAGDDAGELRPDWSRIMSNHSI